MKVLHVIDTLWLGGSQQLLKGVFERSSENSNLFLFALRKTNPLIEIHHKNVTVFNSTTRYSLSPLFELKRLIRIKGINTIHCHLPRSQVFGFLLKKLYFPNLKLIFHDHGDIFEKGIVLPMLLNLFQKKVNVFIACSQAVKQKLQVRARIPTNKIEILRNYVDVEKFDLKSISWNIDFERQQLEILSKSTFVVGFAGRLVDRKGWREFVEAARYLTDRTSEVRDIKFLIAGAGPRENKLKSLIREYNLQNQIICLGYVENMRWFYSLLDCFVMPSHWEGMPLAQLEAASMSVPVISTNAAGLQEVFNGHALYVQTKAPELLAEKIIELIEDQSLRNMLIESQCVCLSQCVCVSLSIFMSLSL